MLCEYCNERPGSFLLKNNKRCCKQSYQSCPAVRKKNSNSVSKSLKKQYQDGTRVSHFKKFNDGSVWLGRTHNDSTKKKISESCRGRKMSDEFKKNRSEEMKSRYKKGWDAVCGRSKKYQYESPIAGKITLDGTWELKTAQYFDNLGVIWRRPTERFEYINLSGKKSTYKPDFYVTDWDSYIEIKGYETELDRCKWSQFPKKLIIWKKKDLQKLKILESKP